MTLIERIKQDQLAFRKAKHPVGAPLLTTLIGEAEMIGKNAGNRAPTDEEVLAVIKKFIKNIDETVKLAMPRAAATILVERDLLSEYLPQQASEEQLKAAVAGYLLREDAQRNMGAVMSFLKSQYAGNYDGRVASSVVKAALA